MKHLIYIAIFVCSLLLGIVSKQTIGLFDSWTKRANISQIQADAISQVKFPRFRLLRKDFNSFNFQSLGGERRFDNGANISILHNFVDPEGMRQILEANCTNYRRDSVKRSFTLDENGRRIRERCVIVHRSSGETRIIWNESETEYWTIDATSLSLAKEFESSETFRLVKSGSYSRPKK